MVLSSLCYYQKQHCSNKAEGEIAKKNKQNQQRCSKTVGRHCNLGAIESRKKGKSLKQAKLAEVFQDFCQAL